MHLTSKIKLFLVSTLASVASLTLVMVVATPAQAGVERPPRRVTAQADRAEPHRRAPAPEAKPPAPEPPEPRQRRQPAPPAPERPEPRVVPPAPRR